INKLVQKASVEAVACPDGVDGLDGERRSTKAMGAAFGNYTLSAALDGNDGNETRQGLKRALQIAGAGQFVSFVLVRQKDIDALKNSLNVIRPQILRVIVGVKRRGEASLFYLRKEFRQRGTQGA